MKPWIIGLIQSEQSRKFTNLERFQLRYSQSPNNGSLSVSDRFLFENLIVIFQKKSARSTNHVTPSHLSTTLVSDGDRFFPPLVHQKSCPVSDLVTNRPNLEINERASTFQYKRTSDDEATKSEEARRNSVRRESVNSKRSKHQNLNKIVAKWWQTEVAEMGLNCSKRRLIIFRIRECTGFYQRVRGLLYKCGIPR